MANFNFKNLNKEVREKAIQEIVEDYKKGILYISGRLNDKGKGVYYESLIESFKSGDEETLEQSLVEKFNLSEIVNGVNKKVPKNAAQVLSQGEFNRYYIRGLCLWAIENEINEVEVYRARESSWSRPESEAKIGKKLNAESLLEDLRDNIGGQPQFLPEVNSGLSVFI